MRISVPWMVFVTSLFAGVLLSQGPPSTPAAHREVFLLGTAHAMHFEPERHYSLVDLRNELRALRPDMVCAEITPKAFNGPMEGYFPPEAAYVAVIAASLPARFVPADWRIARAWQRRAETMEPLQEAQQAAAIDGAQLEMMVGYGGPTLFDLLHSEAFIALSDRKFEQVVGENTVSDIAAGAWHERNRKIVENCLDAAEGARRVAIVFGANHLAQLRRQLSALGIPAQVAARQFVPAGTGSVPPAVVARWQRNLANLRGILGGSIRVSRDSLEKVRDSHRVQDLEQAIAMYRDATTKGTR